MGTQISDIDAVRAQLVDLQAWRGELSDRISTLIGVGGAALTLAPSAHAEASPVENSFIRAQAERRILAQLEEIAFEWTWRGQARDGDPFAFMAARLEWAEAHLPISGALRIIDSAWRRVARIPATKVNRICPAHPETMTLLQSVPGGLRCVECDVTRTEDETDALARFRILQANPALPVSLAAQIAEIEPATVHQWIRRGVITRFGGLVHLADLVDAKDRERPGLTRQR